jgi:drug/metabolite transporter (DMT)-like permease
MSKDQRDGLLLILLASAGFAFMPTLVKTIYAHSTFEPMDVALWRFIFATPLIWTMVLIRNRVQPIENKVRIPLIHMMILGFIFAFAALSAFFGLERLPASTFIVLFYTYPAMVVVLSIFLGERIQWLAWVALLMALFGVALTVPDFTTEGVTDMLGVGFAFVNALVVAIYYLASKRMLADVSDVFGASAYTVAGTLCTLLLLIPIRGIQLPENIETLLSLLAIAAFCTVLPVFTVNQAIQKIGASQASLISTAEPVMSMVVAMILLGEIILPIQWLGAGFIVASVILLQIRPPVKAVKTN